MKNKNAFTLIELLGVVIILGVVALIITPAVDRIIKNSQNKLYQTQVDNLISSVKSWTSDNKNLFTNSSSIIITLQDLKESNYIEYDVKNPKTDACLSNSMQFKIEKNGKKYTYQMLNETLEDGNDNDCEITNKNISIYLKEDNPYIIEINSNYNIPGVIIKDASGNDLTNTVEVSEEKNVNISILGNYKVIYKVEHDGFKATKIRNVTVVDTTPPTITVPSDLTISTSITSLDLKSGVSVRDNSGANIEVNVVESIAYGVPGQYIVKYAAVDPSGNIATSKRTITISN